MEKCKKEVLPTVKEVLETSDKSTVEILTASGKWVLIGEYEKRDDRNDGYRMYSLGRIN